MKTEFKESQRFRQWWIWLLMSPLILVTAYVIIAQLILGKPIGDKPLPDIGVLLFSLFAFGIIFLVWYMRLDTKINEKGVFMTYRPVLRRTYMWKDIDKTEIIDYGFVGYGFRWRPKHGWVYNIGGNMGLKIYLKSGKHLTIGTQKPNELKNFMDQKL